MFEPAAAHPVLRTRGQMEMIAPGGYVPLGCSGEAPGADAVNEARAAVEAGRLDDAETALHAAEARGEADSLRPHIGLCGALLHALRGDPAAAIPLLQRAEAAFTAAGDDEGRIACAANRAQVYAALGLLEAAQEQADAALRGARRSRDVEWTAHAHVAAGVVSLARGVRSRARAHIADAARGYARSGNSPRQILCHFLLGEIAYDGEDPIRSGAHYRDGLAIARRVGAAPAIDLLTARFEHR